jgi:hypothetical protein
VIGRADERGESTGLAGGNDLRVDRRVIRREQSRLRIHGGNFLPQGPGTLATAVAHVEGEDLAGRGVQGYLNPLPIHLLATKLPSSSPLVSRRCRIPG